MPEIPFSLIILMLMLIPFAILFYFLLFRLIKSQKIVLQENEQIIKEGYLSYEGSNILMPFILKNNLGKILLTNKRLVLKYVSFLEHQIEIPLGNINGVETVHIEIFPMLKVNFIENGKNKSVYFYARHTFLQPFADIEEWKNEIIKVKENYV